MQRFALLSLTALTVAVTPAGATGKDSRASAFRPGIAVENAVERIGIDKDVAGQAAQLGLGDGDEFRDTVITIRALSRTTLDEMNDVAQSGRVLE